MADAVALPTEPLVQRARTWQTKSLLLAFVVLVAVVETAVFFWLVPSSEDVAALAEARLVQRLQSDTAKPLATTEGDDRIIEYPLGLFGVTFSPAGTDRTFRCEFGLFTTLARRDREQLEREFAEKSGRLRHAILMKVRTSALEELQENQLGLIQRRILATCNELLEKPLLQTVGFHDFQLIEE
jgi:flagellar basal body-associated protein FliL